VAAFAPDSVKRSAACCNAIPISDSARR